MAKVHVTAQRDFLESLTYARPFAALAIRRQDSREVHSAG
jgi:hypothetical protein